MDDKLFKRLEEFRRRNNLSVLALCRKLNTTNNNYYRWKKAKKITGPYSRIIHNYLDLNEKATFLTPRDSSTTLKNPKSYSSDIAVIGIGCYYPGASNVPELWENILAKRIQFRRMLDQRLPLSEYYDPDPKAPEKTYLTKAAFIENFQFD